MFLSLNSYSSLVVYKAKLQEEKCLLRVAKKKALTVLFTWIYSKKKVYEQSKAACLANQVVNLQTVFRIFALFFFLYSVCLVEISYFKNTL